jgi:molybdopterin-synthase adenylyltransferase
MADLEDRFARQRLIGGWDQAALASATVVVVGTGALGNEVAKNLALAGVGRLLLCDPDVVDETNLSRAALFTPEDIGRPKVDAARRSLSRLAPNVAIDVRREILTSGIGLGELADADVVVGCLDSVRARMQLLGRCALADAALVDGGTGPWNGEVRVRLSAEMACYGCSLTPFVRGVSDQPRNCAEVQPEGHMPASVAISSMTAAWMSAVTLRLLFGLEIPYALLRIDASLGTTDTVRQTRDPSCPFHTPLPSAETLASVSYRDRVADLLKALPPDADPLAWVPFVVPAWHQCGSRQADQPALVPGSACPDCGAAIRQRTGTRLTEADPASQLADLGVAPQEILPVRDPHEGIRYFRLAV